MNLAETIENSDLSSKVKRAIMVPLASNDAKPAYLALSFLYASERTLTARHWVPPHAFEAPGSIFFASHTVGHPSADVEEEYSLMSGWSLIRDKLAKNFSNEDLQEIRRRPEIVVAIMEAARQKLSGTSMG